MIEYMDGVIPSPEDKRDWKLSREMDFPCGASLDKMIPTSLRIKWLPKHLDQGSVGSCTAHALSLAYSCLIHYITGEEVDYSVLWLYGNRRETTYRGKGFIMRDMVKVATKYGDVTRDLLPENIEMLEAMYRFDSVYESLNPQAVKLIEGYVRLETEEEAKAWLVRYPEIPIIASVYTRDVYNANVSNGRHCMALIGWYGDTAIFQNSWGKKIYPYPEIEFKKINEMWGLIPMAQKINFKDVTSDRWSAEAINEAANDGIIAGFPDGRFAPDQALTREQIAVIWQRMKRYIENMIGENNNG